MVMTLTQRRCLELRPASLSASESDIDMDGEKRPPEPKGSDSSELPQFTASETAFTPVGRLKKVLNEKLSDF